MEYFEDELLPEIYVYEEVYSDDAVQNELKLKNKITQKL